MADIGTPQRQWLVSPTAEVEELWRQAKMQEIRSRIARHKQDIEDLERGRILDLRAKIKMLELELKKLDTDAPPEAEMVEEG